jgi:hypothetical protein
MKDSDTPLTQAEPNSMTTGIEKMNEEAAKGWDKNGYTIEEHMIYQKIKKEEDITKYFLQVTLEVQESIDNVRTETIQDAKMKAWMKSKETEEAAAACAVAIATVPTMTPDTMNALIEQKTSHTAVSI